jgi:gliding motility-associated-like protein
VLEDAPYEMSKDTVICIGQSVQLWAIAHNPDGSNSEYHWSPSSSLNNANIWNPIATPFNTTTYQLIMIHNRCFSDTETVTVGVVPYPDVKVTPPDTTVVAGSPIQLTATVLNNVLIQSYAWSPTNTLSCEHCYNTIATPTFTTTYTFIAISSYGCESIDTVRITTMCDQSQVFIPNTFTPNGDGVNDRFFISGKGLTKITRFQVFNRWGELVYEANNVPPNDPAYGWDGTYKGMVVPPDVFVYVVEAICELGAPLKYTGDISIVR